MVVVESTMEQDEMKMGRKEEREGRREEKRKRRKRGRSEGSSRLRQRDARCPKRKYGG